MKVLYYLYLCLLFSILQLPLSAQCTHPDYDALAAIRDANPFSPIATEWSGCDVCDWEGVSCDGGRVIRLRLSNKNLTSLPPEIGDLSNLISLRIQFNPLTNIPPELGNLSSLINLSLTSNDQLSSIPPELGNISSLIFLNLSDNDQLSSIPPELGNLSSLISLGLSNNQLTNIPPELGNLSSLLGLSLSRNQLTTIPSELGNLSSLLSLDISNNQLTNLPPELGNLSSLFGLEISNNQISCLPQDLSNLCDNNPNVLLSGNPFPYTWDQFCTDQLGVCIADFSSWIEYIGELDLFPGPGNSLINQLEDAQNKYCSGKINQAMNKLNAFINHVASLETEGVLTAEQAQTLIEGAQDLISAIQDGDDIPGCPDPLIQAGTSYDNESVTLILHPNPTINRMQLSWQSPEAGTAHLQVVQLNGEVLKSAVLPLTKGQNSYDLDLSVFPAGPYMLRLVYGEEVISRKVVKVEF